MTARFDPEGRQIVRTFPRPTEKTLQGFWASITAGTSEAMGSWVEIIPANAITRDFDVVMVVLEPLQIANLYYRVDVGTGAAGAETANVATNLAYTGYVISYGGPLHCAYVLPTPRRLAASTRVAARATTNSTTAYPIRVYVYVLEAD